jgi:mycoredoxin
MPALEVVPGADLVFTYLGADGRFHSTGKIDEIPAGARAAVRVVDPKRPPEARIDLEQVFVADLTSAGAGGRHATKLVDRDVFETAAYAQLPPGDGSKFAFPQAPPPPPGTGLPPGAGIPPGAKAPLAGRKLPEPPRNRDRIILYGTAWCGACAHAREFFKHRSIAFDDKDVERDPAAAAELAAKAARAGIAPNRVPIIDVRGTLLQGFDEKRIVALLGVAI